MEYRGQPKWSSPKSALIITLYPFFFVGEMHANGIRQS